MRRTVFVASHSIDIGRTANMNLRIDAHIDGVSRVGVWHIDSCGGDTILYSPAVSISVQTHP
jgi:hypothetical protein